jgi:predicted PurR-regulated permease PerM
VSDEIPLPHPEEARRDWRLAGVIAFALLAVLMLAAALRILWPFLSAIAIGGVLVTLTHGLYERLRRRLGGRAHLAATLMLVGITFLLVVPAFLLALLLVAQANALITNLQSGEAARILASFDLAASLRFLTRYFPTFDPAALSIDRIVLPILQQAPGWVARHGGALAGGIAGGILGFFLVLLSAWYFYVEGRTLLGELAGLSPLPSRYDRQFAAKLRDVIEATFRGQVVTSLAQGIATAVGLLIAGVPGALLWGAVAALLSLLPVIGAAVVWVPATIYLTILASLGERSYGWPIFLAVWGVVVISSIDNVVRPWAMKGKAQLPPIPLLFAVIGGLNAFGFVGLVIGPLVFSLLKTVIDIYKESFPGGAGEVGRAAGERASPAPL